jgi:hypothetical protein
MDDSLPLDFSTLPSIELEVQEEEVVAIAATEVTEAIGRPFHIVHHYFVRQEDEAGKRIQAPFPNCYIDADNEFKWPLGHLDNITFGDLERTAEHGLLLGDPHVIVLDNRPFGNGAPTLWSDIFEFLIKAGGGIGSLYAIGKASRDLAEKARKLGEFLRTKYRRWVGKGAREPISLLAAVLQRRAWRSAELAKYLSLDVNEAQLLLECLGYALVTEGLYSRGEGEVGSVAELLIENYFGQDPANTAADLETYLRERLKKDDE